jgi:predicted NBD/HSP70 family sugar kinase
MKIIIDSHKSRQPSHQGLVKETNIKQIFDLIYDNNGISRSEIAKRNQLARATVSMLVDELAESGLVTILGEGDSASSGRKPIMLEINKDGLQIGALSLRKNTYSFVLYDLKGNEIDVFEDGIVYEKGCAKKIRKNIKGSASHLDRNKLLALCVSIPAKINTLEKSISLSILDIHENCDLLSELKSLEPDLPLLIGNQSSAYVYAEYTYAQGKKIDNMIFFNIGEGVGAGILMNGRAFTGEIGHMSIDREKGPLCNCGKRGCLERLAGENAILKEFAAGAARNRNSSLYKLSGGKSGNINQRIIRKALEAGDRETVKTALKLAEKIAFGISNVVCMFNPEVLVIGGIGIEGMGETFLKMIVQKIEIPGANGICAENRIPIGYSRLGPRSELKGVFRYFLDHIFTITTGMENSISCWN